MKVIPPRPALPVWDYFFASALRLTQIEDFEARKKECKDALALAKQPRCSGEGIFASRWLVSLMAIATREGAACGVMY